MKTQIKRKFALLIVVIAGHLVFTTGLLLPIQSDQSVDQSTDAAAELVVDPNLEALLKTVIEENESMPGVVAAIARKGKPIRIASAGVRKANSPDAITIHDKMHLGSCTKAMTATAIGRLVDQGKMSLDSTISDTLPELSEKIHEDYGQVTVRQLLQHRSGMPSNGKWWLSGGDDISERRQLIAIASLKEKPKHSPGTNYQYSNLGYMMAGLMSARAADSTWEELMQREVFGPLQITSAGFGIPGKMDQIIQPWGHRLIQEKLYSNRFDNPPPIGPAGTVHMNLNDWAKFALAHTVGKDTGYLSNKTLEALHEPPEGGSYALGWGVQERTWAGGKTLAHSGSNTSWFCTVWLAPEKQVAYLAATNVAGGKVSTIVDGVIGDLIKLDQQ